MSALLVDILDNTKNKSLDSPYGRFEKVEFTTADILRSHFIQILSLVFRKSAYCEPACFKSCVSGDIAIELILSLSGLGNFFHKVMDAYRRHDGGITKSARDPDNLYSST